MKRITKALAALMLMAAVVFAAGCTPETDPTNQGGNNNGGGNGDAVTVITYTPEDITSTTAVCGGTVTVIDGVILDEVGVCWSTKTTPTVADTHLSTENVEEHFTLTLEGLEPEVKYYVRAYAMQGERCYYGSVKSFTTLADDHDYVDLGLPSGTLWATCNVGADTPEGYGDYFAWGETTPKTTYSWSFYKYCIGGGDELTKYCSESDHGYNGYTDDLTTLELSDDASAANWGNDWCMPTMIQWEELFEKTTQSWTSQNGISGLLLTASNGNTLFLPASGCRKDDVLYEVSSRGNYWSSSLIINRPNRAWSFDFKFESENGLSSDISNDHNRNHGLSVRPVRSTH